MKKGLFLTVIFILGLVAEVFAQPNYFSYGNSVLNNVASWWTRTVITGGQQAKSILFSNSGNMLIMECTTANTHNSVAIDGTETALRFGLNRTSRINSVGQYRLKSLIKD